MKLGATMDLAGAFAGLDALGGPIRKRLAGAMAAEGAGIIRDEAKVRVPVGKAEEQAVRQFGGSKRPGLLQSAIYSARNDSKSTPSTVHYTVSWNHGKAPHGHLVEFGYRQAYQVIFSKKFGWYTDKTKPIANPKRVGAHSFIGAAYDAKVGGIFKPMVAKGRAILPELIREEKPNV